MEKKSFDDTQRNVDPAIIFPFAGDSSDNTLT